jgi:hypothetical protein
MPWEPSGQRNVLLIQRRALGNGQSVYKLAPFFRREDSAAGVFLTPLSMLMFENSQLTFSAIEFVDMTNAPDASHDGDTYLFGGNGYQALSLGAST